MAYCSIKFIIMDTMLSSQLVHMLACPICKGELTQCKEGSSLQCKPCCKSYPVVEGVPVLLPYRAETSLLTKCETP